MQIPALIRRAALALLLSVTAAAAQAPAPAPADPDRPVTVPNFWDPRARLERPPAGSVGAIRFLAADGFPPFAFHDRRGVLIGFDVDLAQAVCRVLRVPCAIQLRPWDTLVPALREDVGNAIIAGMSPRVAGENGLLATQPYLKIPGRFVAARNARFEPGPPAPEGFVGVVCGSAHQAFLERYFPAMRIACYPSLGAALAPLKEGRLAAVFADALGLASWLHGPESASCCAFTGGAYLDDAFFGAGLSIVVRPEDRPLRAAIDYALREIYRSGTYEELYLRYFPVSLF